ncbi:methyltransferase MppJ [Xylaria palmicola]|nr:methyltransferase MppJ [Xylaria palmicola]
MGLNINDPKRAVASIFNSALAAPGIGAAWELGILDEIRDKKRLNVEEYASKHDLHLISIQGLVTVLATVHVLGREGNEAVAGPLFEEAYQAKSLFHWMNLGQGNLFPRMQYILRNENRTGEYYTRDPAAISYACRDINAQYIDPTFWAAMDSLDFKFSEVVDLGCGSGGRLMQILDRFPEAKGLGVDIAGPSTKIAQEEAAGLGYGDRLAFTEGDVLKLTYRDEYANVDLLNSFMMGHDFWPRENCVETLRRIRASFPKARRFLLGDATRFVLHGGDPKYGVTEADVPVFTLGFEFAHSMMDVTIPSMEDWDGVFAEGGWRCVKKHLTDNRPPLWVIFELEHA